jgi:hypothetical protein
VLQNKKYIEFADDNSVEVMALGRLDEGIEKADPKAATYKTTDETGKEVEYLVEFPNLSVEDIQNMQRSPAGQYNQTGKIPYTSIVDPHTLKEMKGLSGGQSAKGLMELVEEKRKELEAEHGPSVKRTDLKKFAAEKAELEAVLKEKGVVKALGEYAKLEKTAAKMGERILQKAEEVQKSLLEAAGTELDKVEELIDAGSMDDAKKELGALKRALKKTPLEERVDALFAKIDAASGE